MEGWTSLPFFWFATLIKIFPQQLNCLPRIYTNFTKHWEKEDVLNTFGRLSD